MLISLSVQNFGSIKEKQVLSFEADKSRHLEEQFVVSPIPNLRLLKLALIYGANSSGKTNILKALDFLRDLVYDAEEKKTTPLKYLPFLFISEDSANSSFIMVEFVQHQTRFKYEIEFNKTAILRERLFESKSLVFSRETDLQNQYSQIKFSRKFRVDTSSLKTLQSNTLWNNTVLGGFLKTNIEAKALKDVTDWFLEYLKPIVLTKTALEHFVTEEIADSSIDKADVLHILKQADFQISDIIINEEKLELNDKMLKVINALDILDSTKESIISGTEKKLVLKHLVGNESYFLPFDQESEGTQRYYGFAGLLSMLIHGSHCIPIDELESSLHPDLYIHFLLTFLINSQTSQIIATTHNREILNNKDLFRNDVIWFTQKNEMSATELYSLSDFDSSIVRDTTNILNAYKIGKLGGKPNLSDFYIKKNEK